MLVIWIVLSFIVGIISAEFGNYYLSVAIFSAVGIGYLCLKKFRNYTMLLFVVALGNVMALHDKTFPKNENVTQEAGIVMFEKISKRIDRMPLSDNAKAMMYALVLGDKRNIGRMTMQDIRNAGMSHIFVVSGMHIGIIYLIFFWLFKPFQLFSWHKLHRLIVIAIVWFYVIMIGSPLSAVRAALMLTIVNIAWILERYSYPKSVLAVAAMVMLLYDTQQLWDIGFQLSFLSVFAIMTVMPYIREKNKITQLLTLTISAQLFTMPLVAYYFRVIPIFGWVQGILVIPLLPLMMYAMLLCLLFPSFPLFPFAVECLATWCALVAEYVSAFEMWCLGGHLSV